MQLFDAFLRAMGIGLLAAVFSIPASGAEPDSKQIIGDAFALTKSAKSIQDYAKIIQLCQDAREATLSDDLEEYSSKLLAWAHNRRGEVQTERAGEASAAGKVDLATQWDQRAMADFETAVALDPDRWKPLHNRGVAYALAGKYERALADFARVIDLNPEHADARFNRAEVLSEVHRFDEAIVDYEGTLTLRSEDYGAYVGRGRALVATGDIAAALADFEKAVSLDPAGAAAHIALGEAHQLVGNWEAAASQFRQAITLDRESTEAYQSAAWLMATCPEARFRDASLAVQAAEQAEGLGAARKWRVWDTLAAAYANADRYQEARDTIVQAIRTAPPTRRSELEQRLALYEKSEPFRQKVSTSPEFADRAVRTTSGTEASFLEKSP